MHDSALDNPIHTALTSLHAGLARRAGAACRYPAEIAPFLGVPDDGFDDADALATLVPQGDTAYLLGVSPRVGPGWQLQACAPLAQMVCESAPPLADGPPILPLGDADRDAVLALTAQVYPHYFRPQTMRLGRYVGIRLDGRLAAIAGERLGGRGTREISAICTHPDFTGRGLAARLTTWLANDLLAAGTLPFLHVSHENLRAKALYERLGFRLRSDIGFWALRRG